MTTHAMFAPYKSRVVSRGGLLLPLTYLPGTSVEKKITRPGERCPVHVGRNYVPLVCGADTDLRYYEIRDVIVL